MNVSNEKPVVKKRVVLVAGDAERRRIIEEHPDATLLSENLPLRANLSVLENIAVVLQFRTNTYIGEANDTAWKLLTLVGHTGCAEQRDPDLTYEERFVAKLLRAIVLTPPMILIDRPAQLLPDSNYPFFLNKLLLALEGRFEQCWILDYAWNAVLYNSRV
jgi:ABC-type transporter Mla maintaining outer membrane lipid asymmetry ATPase subunit MlaF